MYKSIVVSCDTYYYMLANDLGIDTIAKYMAPFGFGQLTGIDIDGELTGVLPSMAWKQQRFKTPALQKWYAGETISVGIGQGYNAYTPLQMAHAVATLAADGLIKVPHLVRTIEDARDTTKRRLNDPQVPAGKPTHIDIKPEYIAFVKNAMAGVVKEGTGARVFAGAPYTSGGKTGTAQVFTVRQNEKYNEKHIAQNLRDHAWYTAFAPVDHPKIAVAVLVENGGFGASSAAPIARQLLDYVVAGKRPDKLGAVPELSGAASSGADVEAEGD
jgi:penicillin-binding protein 2